MTTAHRPTWAAARGGREQGGARGFGRSDMTSVKDLHLQPMKTRQGGQDAAAVARRDLMVRLWGLPLRATRAGLRARRRDLRVRALHVASLQGS